MNSADALIERSGVHDDWRPLLHDALAAVDVSYLQSLLDDENWLPGPERLLAAFRRDRSNLRYLLIGESPYPRPESANGIAFYDAAVGAIWSDTGLSKAVNRATSLHNIVKAALRAEGLVHPDRDARISQTAIAALDKRGLIRTLAELFGNLERAGCMLLNATLVLHPARKPAVEARYWHGFLACLLESIAADDRPLPCLVLWGKIAQLIDTIPASNGYDKLVSEHPYNVSFIDNPLVGELFAGLRVLQARPPTAAAIQNR